jgi:putative transposase
MGRWQTPVMVSTWFCRKFGRPIRLAYVCRQRFRRRASDDRVRGQSLRTGLILWGATVDFLLTAKRDRKAASRFLRKAIGRNGTPKKITIDKSGANTAAIESHNAETEAGIEIRQIKNLNNLVEQDHRAIKRRLVRPMLGFKSFRSATVTLAGIELMHMIRKSQLRTTGEVRPARQFYSLAG